MSPGVFGRAVYRCLTLGLIRSTGEIKLSQDVSRETSVSSKFFFLLPLLVPTMTILINLLAVSVNHVSIHRLFGLLVLKDGNGIFTVHNDELSTRWQKTDTDECARVVLIRKQ